MLCLGECGDNGLAVAALGGIPHGARSVLDLSIETPEFPGIRAKPAKNAHLFAQRWLGMLGDFGRQLGDQCPFLLGNRTGDGLHVTAKSLHDAAKRHRLCSVSGLRAQSRGGGGQGY